MSAVIAVIGCGNPARSDDGAGVEVIRRLIEQFGTQRAGVRLIDAGTAGMDVMFQVRGAGHVVIVDACRSGSEPGAVFRLPGSEAQTPAEPGFTQHGLRWDHALYAGGRMFGADFARDTEVFLIEAQSIDFGIGLSPAVERGVARVTDEIAAIANAIKPDAGVAADVWLHSGRLHLSCEAYTRHLHDCAAVALLARDGDWWLLPLRAGAGGLQVKLRNARGDRVIEAQEFFRSQGLEDSTQPRAVRLHEDAAQGAFRIEIADGGPLQTP